MKTILAALAAVLLAAAAPAPPAAAPPAAAPGAVRLAPPKRLIRGETALPQIQSPANAMTARINADLRRQDRTWVAGRADCMGRGKDSYVERGATVAMAGPSFFAVEVRHEAYCAGAAHPNTFPDILVYDLATGSRTNWARMIRGLEQRNPSPDAEWGDVSPLVTWPAGYKAYVAKVRAGPAKDKAWWGDCEDLVTGGGGEFYIWPDAKKGGLVLEPNWMPHVAQPCADSVVLAPADLRRLGVDRRLSEAFARRQP